MSNFKTAIALENEIMKASDFTFGYDSSISNVAIALKAVLSNTPGDYIIGGKVKPYGSGGLNVSIEPIYAYKDSTQICAVETEVTEPVPFGKADDDLNRIDIVQVRGIQEEYDTQFRKFNDPSTGTKTTRTVATKRRVKLEVSVKKGIDGSASAPAADEGYVKIAEVIIPARTTNITESLIKNITACRHTDSNEAWTANERATFNPGYLVDTVYKFLAAHNEDGSHRDGVIKVGNIDFGTGATQVKGSNIPAGQEVSLHGVDFTSDENITKIIVALSDTANTLYEYANDIMSRFSFITDLPVAASTENVDIATGGEKNIDGVSVSIGQLVFLKDQTNAIENGFYEVKSGAWNRYTGYTNVNSAVFVHKFVLVTKGTVNKGKVFYLNGDFQRIGVDALNFKEAKITPYAKAFSVIVRDENGRAKVAAPKDIDDIARKNEVDTGDTSTLNAAKKYTDQIVQAEAKTRAQGDANVFSDAKKYTDFATHGGYTDGRNLLDVFGKTTVAEVMEILHNKCNGEGKADFSGLMIGDYLDLPSLTVDGTTYTWNDTYRNLRVVISGFNHYIYCGNQDGNKKNHILWTFRNVVLQKRMNATDTNAGGYGTSELKKYLDGVFAVGLGNALGSSGYLYTISRAISIKGNSAFVTDTVFLPTEVEVFGVPTYGDDQITWNTNIQYPIYRDSSFYRVKTYNGLRTWLWEGTPVASDSKWFCGINFSGGSYRIIASGDYGGVAPAFCTC